MNLALLFFDITSLSGGGGAERFFYDFFSDYTRHPLAKHKMILVTDGIENIEKSGRSILKENTIKILNYRYFNFRFLKFLNKRGTYFLGNVINAFKMRRIIKKHNIDKLIVPFYSPREYYFYKTLNILGIPFDYFIVDCRIPDNYESNTKPYFFRDCYGRFFENIRFENIHTWYSSVEDYVKKNNTVKSFRNIFSYQSRYSKIAIEFEPSRKKNIIVYAARMDEQKDPLYFLSAVKLLRDQDHLNEWKILMFGQGPMLYQVRSFISKNKLDAVSLQVSGNLENTFRESKIFVSTQKYENFPSLAISEAMSKGNVIIAKNVGQTNLLVKDSMNGFLAEEGRPETLALCLNKAIGLNEDQYLSMACQSLELMRNEHTVEKFIEQFDRFVVHA